MVVCILYFLKIFILVKIHDSAQFQQKLHSEHVQNVKEIIPYAVVKAAMIIQCSARGLFAL